MNLVVLNPNARGGQARNLWPKLQPALLDHFDNLLIVVARRVEDVAMHIDKAREVGVERILTIGGDGTNHVLVNALLNAPSGAGALPIAIGQIPVGTGRDWARTLGIPHDPVQAIKWLAQAQPQPCDVGKVTIGSRSRLFLNIASAGASWDITRRVQNVSNRKPWTFLRAILTTITRYKPPPIRMAVDGALFYEGTAYIAVVANGKWFGHGIMAAPGAEYSDGRFDVLVLEGMPRLQFIRRLMQAYKGEHVGKPGVHAGRGQCVEVTGVGTSLGIELDGEPQPGNRMHFEVIPAALHVLVCA